MALTGRIATLVPEGPKKTARNLEVYGMAAALK